MVSLALLKLLSSILSFSQFCASIFIPSLSISHPFSLQNLSQRKPQQKTLTLKSVFFSLNLLCSNFICNAVKVLSTVLNVIRICRNTTIFVSVSYDKPRYFWTSYDLIIWQYSTTEKSLVILRWLILNFSMTKFFSGQIFRITSGYFNLEDTLRILISIDVVTYSSGRWEWIYVTPSLFGLF